MYRAVSFWIDWRFLDWPNEDVRDMIIRRCDEMAAANINMAVVFGTHFRWDYLPIMTRVHDMLAFTAEQLHQRDIKLFDHHSSVLTHRIRKPEDREHIRKFNYHHLAFYPDADFVSQMKYNGSYLNDWRMIDVETGKPIFIDVYNCEQFCMNNPDFQAAYQTYIRRLLADVPLDGLMSDDGIYYAGWRACGCIHCRKKFATVYGHELPPTSDSSFWFNRESQAFLDWIAFRYKTVADFMCVVQEITGDLPLMTCCSNSSGQVCNAHSTSYEEFAPHNTMSMLEVSGRGINEKGDWTAHFMGRAMLQIAITNKFNLDACLILGYGFTKDSFELFWHINRLLGADAWLSTLKGRLIPKCSSIKSLPEEQALVGNIFSWEKSHEELFSGVSDAKVGIYFSRDTRDNFARSYFDFEAVYKAACQCLFEANVTFDVFYDIDDIFKYKAAVLPAAACLSQRHRDMLRKYMQDGGTIVASGPIGMRDDRNKHTEQFMGEFGIDINVEFPPLPAGYQPTEDVYNLPGIKCSGGYNGKPVVENEWVKITLPAGRVYWTPAMDLLAEGMTKISDIVRENEDEPVEIISGLDKWYVRRYRRKNGIILVGMNSSITPVFSKNFALSFGTQYIVEKLQYSLPCRNPVLKTKEKISSARIFSPECNAPLPAEISADGTQIRFSCDGINKFFVAELLTC